MDYSVIGSSCLSIDEKAGSFSVPNLENDLFLLGIGREKEAFLIGLKNGAFKKVDNQEPTYLNFEEGGLLFSKQKTPLLLEGVIHDDERVSFSLSLLIEDEGSVLVDEKSTFSLKIQENGRQSAQLERFFDPNALSLLENGSVLNSDRLLELYGDGALKEKGGLERLCLDDGSILYIKSHDLLVFDEGSWSVSSVKNKTEKKFCAKICAILPQKIELELWDKEGLVSKRITIDKGKEGVFRPDLSSLFSKIKRRTARIASLTLGKNSLFLKENDWVLRQENGWRLLRNLDEIDRVLSFDLKGELFIFDGFKKSRNQILFKGHLFDQSRSRAQEVCLNLAPKKNERGHLSQRNNRHFAERNSGPYPPVDDEFEEDSPLQPMNTE